MDVCGLEGESERGIFARHIVTASGAVPLEKQLFLQLPSKPHRTETHSPAPERAKKKKKKPGIPLAYTNSLSLLNFHNRT